MLVVRVCLIVLILATLSFIFGQSMLSAEESTENSEAVGGFIAEIIPPGTPLGDYVQKNVRKIAHFTEFFVLGAEIAIYMLVFHRKMTSCVLVYPFALTVAVLDETIQVFSKRGPEIVDVWIDFFGFFTSYTLIVSVFFLAHLLSKKYRDKKNENNENNTEYNGG